jgi:hypothetical protein
LTEASDNGRDASNAVINGVAMLMPDGPLDGPVGTPEIPTIRSASRRPLISQTWRSTTLLARGAAVSPTDSVRAMGRRLTVLGWSHAPPARLRRKPSFSEITTIAASRALANSSANGGDGYHDENSRKGPLITGAAGRPRAKPVIYRRTKSRRTMIVARRYAVPAEPDWSRQWTSQSAESATRRAPSSRSDG